MPMPFQSDAVLLRIFIGSDDSQGDRPLYEAILMSARDAGLAGATVSKGIAGYGRSALVHSIVRGFSQDVPIVVDIIDRADKIEAWLQSAESLLRDALVTWQDVRVVATGTRT